MMPSPERSLDAGSRVILAASSWAVSAGDLACDQSHAIWETLPRELYSAWLTPWVLRMWRYWKRTSNTNSTCSQPTGVSRKDKKTLVPAEVLDVVMLKELANPSLSLMIWTNDCSPPYVSTYSMYRSGWLRYSCVTSGSGKKIRSSVSGCIPLTVTQCPKLAFPHATGRLHERRPPPQLLPERSMKSSYAFSTCSSRDVGP
mmetsp:Transcript_65049/g.205547  ORF Transcript_65049/g.205547 Transcript_65049/m.205547 type:complete len:201 (-) Transcript_65049:174-776(-)